MGRPAAALEIGDAGRRVWPPGGGGVISWWLEHAAAVGMTSGGLVIGLEHGRGLSLIG